MAVVQASDKVNEYKTFNILILTSNHTWQSIIINGKGKIR